ncbi:MAG TPA: MlaE family lipid ABC transporter permease subunit [Candidatus Binatia bacterium]|jgi:phospholipid/cholesterol/gamma-HCH transport system permease protein
MAAASHSVVNFKSEGPRDGTLKLILAGRLDAETTGTIWRRAVSNVKGANARNVVVDASGIEYCDGAGIALLVQLKELERRKGGNLEIIGLLPQFVDLLNDSASRFPAEVKRMPAREGIAEEIGRNTFELWRDIQALINFIGELSVGLVHALVHPRGVRWRDALTVAEAVGVNALPIVALVSFLMGLIMAFQAAIPLRQFGAQLYIANLIGLSMLRELGPLMTAVILAGRSGSAFAAELGTMKVREEIDALKTMGLDPVRFLIVTRVIAAVVMTPLLTVFANLMGLIGGFVVMRSLGFPLVTYFHQVQYAVSYGSLIGGLVKSFVFGILVAAIGCLRGLQTGTGATAVGQSTTSAVVSGIILITITDGIFALVYYYLGV